MNVPNSKLRIFFFKLINRILNKVPPSKIKNTIFRSMGVKLGKEICLPMDVVFDPIYPHLIEIGDNTLIGGYTKFMAHQIIDGISKVGKIKIGKNCLICSCTEISPNITIGDNVIVGTKTKVTKNVQDYTFVGGRPHQIIKILDKEWNKIEHNPNYYNESKKQITDFIKHSKESGLDITYHGNRGNAGNDWHRVRNTFRIYLTAAIIEFANFFPNNLKLAIFRLTGARIGKNVVMEKNALIDHIYPELVTIEDNVNIGEHTYIGAHDFINNRIGVGRPLVKRGAHIKNNVMMQYNVTVGENCIVEPYTFINRNVPDNHLCQGQPGLSTPLTT